MNQEKFLGMDFDRKSTWNVRCQRPSEYFLGSVHNSEVSEFRAEVLITPRTIKLRVMNRGRRCLEFAVRRPSF
jgi:hypothetical protein